MMVTKGTSADEDIILRSLTYGVVDTLCGTSLHERQAVFSPDGEYLAYVRVDDNVNNVFVLNMETRESRQVSFAAPGQNCSYPVWGADGKQLFIQGTGFYEQPAIFLRDFTPF
jgi:Tol biopolymer transport system component